jgi:hypothetical protein
MKNEHLLFAICCVALSACQGASSDEGAAENFGGARVLPPDDEIIALVYDSTYTVPGYFYVDERAETPQSYTVYHVKDVSNSYELCTDDYQEALDWEAADNDRRAVTGVFVNSYENDRYFEFIRELAYPDGIGNITDPTSPGFARVFKCSYANRDGVDRNLRDGYAGTLNVAVLTQNNMQIFSEYLWQFTFFWPARKKVLETYSTEQKNSLQHALLLAFVTNQGIDKCDLIEVVDWTFEVDKSNGQITKEFRLVHQMNAQLVDGVPEKCFE